MKLPALMPLDPCNPPVPFSPSEMAEQERKQLAYNADRLAHYERTGRRLRGNPQKGRPK